MIGPATELVHHFDDHFRVLILDNEVTVDTFVTDPPLPWARLTVRNGVYRIGEGYPRPLTAAEAGRDPGGPDRRRPKRSHRRHIRGRARGSLTREQGGVEHSHGFELQHGRVPLAA